MNILHIVSIICFGMCLVMFFYLKWYIKKNIGVSKKLEDSKTEVNRIIAEMTRITDRDVQIIEDRVSKLKALLEETDKRFANYVKELEKSRSSETLYTSLGHGIRQALNQNQEEELLSAKTPALPSLEDTISISSQAETARPIHRSFTETPEYLMNESPAGLPVKKNSQTQESSPPSMLEIRNLIDQYLNEGLSVSEIASRLGISAAEVNLAMNLRR